MTAPGQDPGHLASGGVGFDWAELVDALVTREGSLSAVARVLAAERAYTEQIESIERALRRLRSRGAQEGGAWGERVLRTFGLPAEVCARVRWMGCYHSRFTDLPRGLCLELLLPWERPPVSESPSAAAWLHLARASLCIRGRDDAGAALAMAKAARALPRADAGATVEWCLVEAYRVGRTATVAERDALLDRAEEVLHELVAELASAPGDPELAAELALDLACWQARLVDQRAYALNKPRADEDPAQHALAEALYRALPEGGPPFARCRRANGLAWSVFKQGRTEEALALARQSVEAAGDAGSLRMRAMALSALARFLEADEGTREAARACRVRARAIAQQLEDEALLGRFGAQRSAGLQPS